jgi:L-galactose dehydrogenase
MTTEQQMQYRTLGRTSLNVSVLGFGASPLGDVFGITDPKDGERAVHLAVDRGINFFDVSPYYGLTLAEERLGCALRERRHKIILATKCGRYGVENFDFSARRVREGVEESLRRLKTDYVDLLQAHDVEFGDVHQIIGETLPEMRRLQQEGKARFIGITGYPLKVLRRIAEAVEVDTILSYCRYNLVATDMDAVLTSFAQEHKIGMINASPLMMGILTVQGPAAWHPAPPQVRELALKAALRCNREGVSLSLIALQYCLRHAYVSSTLTGMSTPEEVEENLSALCLKIDDSLLEELKAILAPVANTVWPSGRPENRD